MSNPAKPFEIAKYWAELVQEEFFLQGDQEHQLGLPLSPYMGRENSSISQLQLAFIDHIVLPIFRVLCLAEPNR